MTIALPFRRLYSSKVWLARQAKDPYVKLAKESNFRARSSFKLIQIDKKYSIFQKNDIVVDCGAAPGGWTQVAARKVGRQGLVVGIDLLPVEPFSTKDQNIQLIEGNFMTTKTQKKIKDMLNGQYVNVVLTDMAPNFSGNHLRDHARSIELCESVLTFAKANLLPGGHFIAKFLAGGTEGEFKRKLQSEFQKVMYVKPDASRKQSSEGYYVAMDFKPSATKTESNENDE
ncbi:ribosomal RNA large subunit methyltransferase J [Mycotypha africana]|uniref:ribosomal RNA large subunit methyltransferase J n=1 Tax=Mycotypha africana TaxID=64632 RepID=UPI002301E41E|nr:ribosomal RNA large subunit methyltransferase J [Mycotypha africana]KAI8971623.1 ribosomal RNA large subunit methyltransferase J [Mycotypha africana]